MKLISKLSIAFLAGLMLLWYFGGTSISATNSDKPNPIRLGLTYNQDCAPDDTNTWRIREIEVGTPTVWELTQDGVVIDSGTVTAGFDEIVVEVARKQPSTAILKWDSNGDGSLDKQSPKASGPDLIDPALFEPGAKCGPAPTTTTSTVLYSRDCPEGFEFNINYIGGIGERCEPVAATTTTTKCVGVCVGISTPAQVTDTTYPRDSIVVCTDTFQDDGFSGCVEVTHPDTSLPAQDSSVQLPATGSDGTVWILITGIVAVLCGSILLIARR